MSTPSPAGPPSYAPPSRPPRPFLVGGAIGVVLAAVVAVVLLLTGTLGGDGGDGGDDGGGTDVSLPDELDGLRSIEDVQADLRDDDAPPLDTGSLERGTELTEEAYAEAYDGADVEVARYSDDELTFQVTVVAVGAPSPGPVLGPQSEPSDLGLAANLRTLEQVGDVTCERTLTTTVPEGEEVDPDEVLYGFCQRSSDDLTVMVYGNGTPESGGRDRMVSLTEAAFEAAG